MRVLHLVGSPTTEFFAELSRLYAAGALQALRGDGREHVVAHVAPDGTWTFPADLTPAAIAEAPALALPAAVERLTALAPDVAVPQLFCVAGMTTYRSLLDVLGIPFVGNRAETMAIGAHKPHARALVAAAGVPVAEARVLRRGEHPDLPAEADIGGGARPLRGRPGFGDQRHADAELAAETEAGDGAVEQQVPVTLCERAHAGEDGEEDDRPGQDSDAADAVRQHAEADAAQHRADQRGGDERGGLALGQLQVGGDRPQHEAEDQQVEAVHGIADRGAPKRLAGLAVDFGRRG